MTRLRRLLCIVLACGSIAADGPPRGGKPQGGGKAPKVGTGMGNAFLRSGRPVVAAQSFRKQLELDPEAVAARVGLAKSLARQGRCEDALVEFSGLEYTTPFGADAALAAAICQTRLGYPEDALAYDRLAVELEPENARAWTNYALDLHAWGDTAGLAGALEELEVIGREGRDASLYVSAVIAMREGRIDELDVLLQLLAREGRSNSERRRLLAQSWLDMGDPISALAVLKQSRKVKKSYQESWLRAEALRRIGEPEDALRWVDSARFRPYQGTVMEAERIRIAIDLGDLGDAERQLAKHADAPDEEIVASRWYLARAKGDTGGMAEAERAYLSVRMSPLRRLDDLVPVTKR